MNIFQTFLLIGLLTIYCILVAISIINTQTLYKKQTKFNKEQFQLLIDISKSNSVLTCQRLEIMTIIDEADKSKELYKETVEKIKKVIYPNCKAEIDNF